MYPFIFKNVWGDNREYHIFLKRKCLAKNYKENHPNHNNLWDDVKLCIQKSEYNSFIESYNYDWDRKDTLYMYIHVNINFKDKIKSIIDLLNQTYQKEWIFYCNIPKLSSIIARKFEDNEFLINSILEDQRIYGYESTKAKTECYLKIIKPSIQEHLMYDEENEL